MPRRDPFGISLKNANAPQESLWDKTQKWRCSEGIPSPKGCPWHGIRLKNANASLKNADAPQESLRGKPQKRKCKPQKRRCKQKGQGCKQKGQGCSTGVPLG